MPSKGISYRETRATGPPPTRKWKGKVPPELQEHATTKVKAKPKRGVTGHLMHGSRPSKAKQPHDVKMHGTHIRYSGR